jgi:hemerythrin superfamily protein
MVSPDVGNAGLRVHGAFPSSRGAAMTRPKSPADTDIVDLLIHQHAQIRDLFAEVHAATGDGRRAAFGRMVRLLAVHETAEEEIVHPIARRALPGGDGIVGDRLEEERAAKELLSDLEDMDPDRLEFLRRLDELRIAVLDHARAEERYEFFRLREEFSVAQRRGMAAAVKAAEAAAPTHPHPGTESAAKNMLTGPLLAMTDRVRDLIRNAGDGERG